MEKQLEDKLGKRKGCSSLILSSGSGWAVPPYLEIAVVVLLPFPRLGLGPHLHRGTARDATAVSSQTFVVFPAKQDGHSHATRKYNYVWDPGDMYLSNKTGEGT